MNKLIFLVLFILYPMVNAQSETIEDFNEPSQQPLYEFGVFGGAGLLPDYPAANQGRLRYIAIPYGRYRGTTLRVDEDSGVGARIFRRRLVGFDLSGGGSFPARSRDNDARRNMPNLDWLGEVGPRMYLRLINTETERLVLSFPLRFAFSTDFSYLKTQGVVFAPGLSWQRDHIFFEKFTLFIAGSLNFSSQELMSYFYEVEPKYSTSERPAYHAKAGYLGYGVFTGGSFDLGAWGVGGGIRFAEYSGATNQASPLFKATENWMYVIGFSYRFYESKQNGFK